MIFNFFILDLVNFKCKSRFRNDAKMDGDENDGNDKRFIK